MLVLLLVARLLHHVLLYRAGFQSVAADEFGRTVFAAQWAQQPYAISWGAWLPLHIYLLGVALWLHWDLLLTPQSMTICFGLVSLVLMYQLGKQVTGTPLLGLLSAALLAFNPAHVWVSAVPLSEGMFTLFWLAGLCAVLSFHAQPRASWLLVAGAMFGVANGVRYEGWFVSAFFSLYLAAIAVSRIRERRRAIADYLPLLGSFVVCWSFPVVWLVGNARATGDMLYWMHYISSYKLERYGVGQYYANYLWTALRIDPFILPLACVGLVALWLRHRSTSLVLYAMLTVAPLMVFITLHGGQIEPPGNYLRYLAPFVFVCYPLMAYALFVAARTASRRRRPVAAVLLAVLLGGIGAWQIRSAFRFENDPAAIGLSIGQRITQLRSLDGASQPADVLIELTYWQYMAIHVGANDMEHIVYDRKLDIEKRDAISYFLTNLEAIRHCVEQGTIRYIVAASPDIQQIVERDLELPMVTSVGTYRFYDVTGAAQATTTPARCQLD